MSQMELYGLFGAGTGPADQAPYYRIQHSGPDTGFICNPLYQELRHRQLPGGSKVELYRTKLGPISFGADDCYYELDERRVLRSSPRQFPDAPPPNPARPTAHSAGLRGGGLGGPGAGGSTGVAPGPGRSH